MHLNAIFYENNVFMQGSPAVFFATLQSSPASPGEVFGVKLQIPVACRNHLWVFFRVWPGVNIRFVKTECKAGRGHFIKLAKTRFLQTCEGVWN